MCGARWDVLVSGCSSRISCGFPEANESVLSWSVDFPSRRLTRVLSTLNTVSKQINKDASRRNELCKRHHIPGARVDEKSASTKANSNLLNIHWSSSSDSMSSRVFHFFNLASPRLSGFGLDLPPWFLAPCLRAIFTSERAASTLCFQVCRPRFYKAGVSQKSNKIAEAKMLLLSHDIVLSVKDPLCKAILLKTRFPFHPESTHSSQTK